MAIEERKVIDRIEILRDGTIQVREAHEILKDGEVISTQYHRYVINIGEELPDISRMEEKFRMIVKTVRSDSAFGAVLCQ